MTKDEFRKAVDDVITDCIRNDYSFGSYAYKVAEALWPLLEAAEKERDALRTNVERMEKIESAAQNLVKMKGRHNTEIGYRRLVATLEESK